MMELTSPAFADEQLIPELYTCDGDNISPPLVINNLPENTQSLALIVDDPDAPTGDWVHWLVWNMSPQRAELQEGQAPEEAIEGTTDFNKTGYGGPCPPSGLHGYQFKLYALDTTLELDATSTKKDLENAMQGHILEQTQLTGNYQR